MSFLGNSDHAHALQDLIAAHHDGGYIIHVDNAYVNDENYTRTVAHIGDDPADHDMVFWEKTSPVTALWSHPNSPTGAKTASPVSAPVTKPNPPLQHA